MTVNGPLATASMFSVSSHSVRVWHQ